MKICAIICEFNPFHNGHKYLLERAREFSGCDAFLCIMSGSFTQRGEMCILDKYTRARHAVLGGADCVIQLPAPFAVAPAEIFAKGAIKILSTIPEVTHLAFGCESGSAFDFMNAASLVSSENAVFKSILNNMLSVGESFIKSYSEAFRACGGDSRILSKPNNVLGFEYTKSILRWKSDIRILPVIRIGADYNDPIIKENFSSATAIRQNLNNPTVLNNMPAYVYNDLNITNNSDEFENMMRHCLFTSKLSELNSVYGCSEGLENKLKSLENEPYKNIIAKTTSKRYTSSRIRRILCANMLGLYQNDCERFLNDNLYIKPLAVRKEYANAILASLASSIYPLVTNEYGKNLTDTALECFEKDKYEYAVYNHINMTSENKDHMLLV